jgi:hypothetical protein
MHTYDPIGHGNKSKVRIASTTLCQVILGLLHGIMFGYYLTSKSVRSSNQKNENPLYVIIFHFWNGTSTACI